MLSVQADIGGFQHERGVVATCQAAVQSWGGAMALRFLLGLTEAGYGPGVPYLLSFFYRRHELGVRVGIFVSAAPLANTFASALAYGITSGHSKLSNWRLLFLVEGLPTVIMAFVSYYFLPDSPGQARFLNEEEKAVARARGVRQVGNTERVGGVNWKEIGATLLDAKAWITAVCCLTIYSIKFSFANGFRCSSCISVATLAFHRCQSFYPLSLRRWATLRLTLRV